MIRRPPRSTLDRSSAASDVYKRQHVVSAAMLHHPMSVQHLGHVMLTLTSGGQPRLLDWVGPTLAGRRVRLAHSNTRQQRLERMADFFDSKGVGSRTIDLLRDCLL